MPRQQPERLARRRAYDAIAEKAFGSLQVVRFVLEYDTDRAGGFGPIRFVPRKKMVVLNLISFEDLVLESQDLLRKRIYDAARYLPLENHCKTWQKSHNADSLPRLPAIYLLMTSRSASWNWSWKQPARYGDWGPDVPVGKFRLETSTAASGEERWNDQKKGIPITRKTKDLNCLKPSVQLANSPFLSNRWSKHG